MTGFPILGIFFTILIVFAWIMYFWVAIAVISDIFRRTDLSGWGKAAWIIAVAVLSWFGVLIYLIANSDGMNERKVQEAKAVQGQFDDYLRSVTATGGPASEIEKAKRLLDSGAIDQAQFNAIKSRALA